MSDTAQYGSADLSPTYAPTAPDQSVWNRFTSSISGALGAVVQDVLPLRWARDYIAPPVATVYNKVAQAESTGWLAANPNSKDFLDLGSAWRDAVNVSPGQGALSQVTATFPTIGSNTQWAKDHAYFVTPGFDPANPDMRKKAFEEQEIGMLASGATDAAITYVADPLVVGGKAAKLTTRALLTNPATGANASTKLATEAAQLADHAMGTRTTLGDALEQATQSKDFATLASHPVVAKANDPALVASLLHGADTFDDKATVYLAGRGDPAAMAALEAQRPSVAAQLEQANLAKQLLVEAKRKLSKVNPDGSITHDWQLNADEIAKHKQIIDDLNKRDAWLAKATGNGQNDNGVFRTLTGQGFSPSTFINERRLARAEQAGQVKYGTTETYKAGPYSPVVHVVNYAGNLIPNGIAKVAGAGATDSYKEVLASLQAAKMDGVTTRYWMTEYAGAVTATDRMTVLTRMEQDLVNKIAERHGVTPDMASTIYKGTVAARAGAVEHYKSLGGYGIHEDGSYFTSPATDSQLAQQVPLIDFAAMDQAVYDSKHVLSQTMHNAQDTGAAALSAMYQVWKPAVLLRVGFLLRNVGESQIASWVAVGRTVGNPLTGVAHAAGNVSRRATTFIEKASKVQNPGLLGRAESQELLTAKVTDIEALKATYQDRLDRILADQVDAAKLDQMPLWSKVFNDQELADIAEHKQVIAELSAMGDATRDSLSQIANKQAAKATVRRTGDKTTFYRGVPIPGATEGAIGDIMRQEVSAEAKNRLVQHTVDSAGREAKWLNRRMKRTGGFQRYNPGDVGYFDEAARVANQHFRNSEISRRLLQGESPTDVGAWLTGTTQGQGVMREMGWGKQDVGQGVHDLADMIDRYYPDEKLQQLIAKGDVTGQQVAARLAGKPPEHLSPIHGEEIAVAKKDGIWDTLVAKGFHYMGTLPEDTMARVPLYNSLYMREMRSQIDQYAEHLGTLSAAEANRFIEQRMLPAARSSAKNGVNRIIYSPTMRTRPASALRYMSPFFQVTQNRLGYYGRAIIDNPDQIARLYLGWNALGNTKDANGNTVITTHLPGPVAKFFGVEDTPDLSFNKQSLNLITQGEPWWSPGWGPAVTVPVAQMLRDNPDSTPSWLKSLVGSKGLGLFPNNYYGANAAQMLTPTIARRIIPFIGSDHDAAWVSTQGQIMAIEMHKYETGQRSTKPTMGEVADRTDAMWLFRVAAAGLLPAQPQLDGPLKPMIDLHRQYQQQFGADADSRFLADHPEYFDFILSVTKSDTSVAPNDVAVSRAKKYGELLNSLDNSKMSALVTNLPQYDTQFDKDAYDWEKSRSVTAGSSLNFRDTVSPDDALNNRVVERGWIEYKKLTNLRDAFMQQLGVTSLSDPRAKSLKVLFDIKKRQLAADNPEWDKSFNERDYGYYGKNANSLAQIVTAPGYFEANKDAQPWLKSARDYLVTRQTIAAMLEQRKNNGLSGDIGAKQNADLAAVWAVKQNQLNGSDPQWSDIFHRYFEGDNLKQFADITQIG